MDKMTLQQYRAIKKEIAALEDKIYSIRLKPPFGTDIVKGSDTEFPYCEKSFTVSGVDRRKLDRLTRVYEKRRDALLEETLKVEEWLDGIEDSSIRQIVQYRYLDGFSWRKTAMKVYGKPCEDAPRRAVERFLSNN